MKLKNLILLLGLASITATSSLAFAANLKLYDQPNTTAKVTAEINPAAGMVKVYSPKGSEWVKVADPANGNVGWIKTAELKKSHVTVTETYLHYGNAPMGYNVVQFGPPHAQFDQREAQKMFEQMRKRQRAIQLTMQRAMQEMAFEMQSFPYWADFGFPMVMPVMVMPPHHPVHVHPAYRPQVALQAGVHTAKVNQHQQQHMQSQVAQNNHAQPQTQQHQS